MKIILISLAFNIDCMTQKKIDAHTNRKKRNDDTINQFKNATYDAFNNTWVQQLSLILCKDPSI